MGEYDLDKEDSNYKKQHKRLAEFKSYIADYQSRHLKRTGEHLHLIDEAAEKITSLYFVWLETNVKPWVPKRINKYKISSLAEICIVKVQPFYIKEEGDCRKFNAEFAFVTSLSFILNMANGLEDFNKFTNNVRADSVFETVKNQRISWLEAKNVNAFPVFCNGLNLFLLFELYHLRLQATAQ